MNNKQKVKKTVELFEKIQKIWAKDNVSLCVHGVDMDSLPNGWKVTGSKGEGGRFWTAKKKDAGAFGITLFE